MAGTVDVDMAEEVEVVEEAVVFGGVEEAMGVEREALEVEIEAMGVGREATEVETEAMEVEIEATGVGREAMGVGREAMVVEICNRSLLDTMTMVDLNRCRRRAVVSFILSNCIYEMHTNYCT